MCGIVGYVGREQAAPILLDGLRRLEYRGYDSAGLAVVSPEGNLQVVKSAGRLQALADKTHDGADLTGTMGIGHTRWATHGEPSDVNSHPHVSEDGRIAVVHNGIVENYLEIKQFLQSKGVTFQSETDSEVVAQLLEYYYEGDILKATFRVLDRIEGAYALGIICADAPDRLIAARKMSPLVLGYGEDCSLIASDVTALIAKTREVCYMDDDEVAVLSRDGIEVFNAMGDPIEKEHSFVDWDISAAEKGGYPHFMFKEILEQPEAVTKTIAPRIRDGRIVLDDLDLSPEYVRSVSKIYVIACGSSYHVGVVGKYNLEKLLRKPVEVVLASEFRYCDLIGLYFADALGTISPERYAALVAELQRIPEKMQRILDSKDKIQYYASRYFNHESVFFIGRNLDYALGLEGSLKLKEISYIHSEAYASGELKHGTISLIEPGTLVVALGTYGPLFDKAMSNVLEVKARGADVLALTTERHEAEMAHTADGLFVIPDTEDMLLPNLGVLPLQLFAYYIALMRGCDIDKPRNLAKSVTVE